MDKAEEIEKSLAITLEKYRKNKTLVPAADLAGKYKVPFEKLKAQLKEELETYLTWYSLQGLAIAKDEEVSLKEFEEAVNRILSDPDIGKRAGKAAFKEFDIQQIKQIAEELRNKIYNEAWVPYFHKHTGLYVTAESFNLINPQSPRIYNYLVDKFWNEETGEWTKG